jgi:O-antigen/teichoic acid export membrane protein
VNLAQRVAVNTGLQAGGRAISIALGLVTIRLTATYFDLTTFGQLATILAVTGLLATVANFGVTTTLAREIAKEPEAADVIAGTLLRFMVASVGAVCAGLLLVTPLLPYSHATKIGLALASAGLFFTVLAGFPGAFFQIHLRLGLQAVLDVAARALGLAAILVVRGFALGFYSLVVLTAAGSVAICLLAFAFSRRFWRINLRFERARARTLVRDSVAIGFVTTIGLLHFRGDAVLLSLLKPARDVGLYSVAYRFVDQAFLLPGLFVAAVFPIIARTVERDRAAAARTIRHVFQVLAISGIAMALLLFELAPPLVRLIAGPGFGGSAHALRILAGSIVFIYTAPVFYNVLIAVNRQRELIGLGLVSLALNFTLNLVLIPRYSYDGAAAATVVSEAFSVVGSYVIARRAYGLQVDGVFVTRAAAAAAVAAIGAAALRGTSPWLACGVAEALFLGCAYAFRAVNRADLQVVFARRRAA